MLNSSTPASKQYTGFKQGEIKKHSNFFFNEQSKKDVSTDLDIMYQNKLDNTCIVNEWRELVDYEFTS